MYIDYSMWEEKKLQIVLDFYLVRDLLVGVIVCLFSVKLVEQELWQKEEKGLIGVLPVRDSEATAVGSLLSPGEIKTVASNFAV
jgi:hypothetical protein